jgi:hypothetical protein
MKNTRDHDPASFTLFVSILGALAGVVAGYGLDRVVDSRRLLALIAAVFVVAVIVAFRNSLGRISPALRVRRAGSKIPSYFWKATCLATIIGGLAGGKTPIRRRIRSVKYRFRWRFHYVGHAIRGGPRMWSRNAKLLGAN